MIPDDAISETNSWKRIAREKQNKLFFLGGGALGGVIKNAWERITRIAYKLIKDYAICILFCVSAVVARKLSLM